ncbi:uncharacterized protein LOC125542279 [Triticum urartu]|uniref:uncharacterized protein LOC125542279 n=1 Tax=Triticum urartu TaxID=4572 RepID=UPI002042D09E|nr:uncharacterized protein LOC125542279 [Triticum urartu]
MQRCVEDDCRRAEVWCFQLQRQPVDVGKSYNHGVQQIEDEVQRELDDGVLRPSPPGLPWPVSTVAQGCGGERGFPVNTMPRTSVGRPRMHRREHVASEHEAVDERGRPKDASARAGCRRA